MAPLPPEMQARLDAIAEEVKERLARMPPLDVAAELRRIDARFADMEKFRADLHRQAEDARRQAERQETWWDRWMPAVVVVSSMAAGAALFAAGMFVASQMPPGRHDDDVLALAAVSLFLVVLAVLLPRL